jgi:hypothetical protein
MMDVALPRGFKVGDRVRWINALSSDYTKAEGTIVRVVPVTSVPEFTLYDIRFEFGNRTVLGSHVELADRSG